MYNIKYVPKIPKYLLKCEICEKEYRNSNPKSKACSTECRNRRNTELSGRFVVRENTGLPTGTVGAITELLVCSDLMRKGYAVFRALSPSCFCDAVAVKGDKSLFIEIRTGYKNQSTGTICFSRLLNGVNSQINCYGVYERNSNQVYYFDLNNHEYIF